MSYVIRYHTATHMGMEGDFDTLQEAQEAYTDRKEWYDHRLGAIVEGTVEFPDGVRHAELAVDINGN